MKKFLLTAVLALSFLAASGQQASAWKHFKFSAGMSMEFTGGGNCLLWGLYKSSPVPEGFGGYGYPDMGGPVVVASGDSSTGTSDGFKAPAPTPAKQTSYETGWSNYSGYQPVNYYDYSNAGYGYGYGYGYYPSSWYGQ